MQQFKLPGNAPTRCHAAGSSTSRCAATNCNRKGAAPAFAPTAPTAHDAASLTIEPEQLTRRGLVVASIAAAVLPAPNAAAAPSSAGDWTSPGLAAPEDDALPRFFKTPSGVKVQELLVGSGPEVQQGDAVLLDYVLRRSNGYFIYGTIEGVSFQPRDVPVGPIKLQLGSGEVIEGLESALIGMRQGGKRRILVPPEAGYVSNVLQPQMPTFGTKRQLANHSSEPLLFEVELLRIVRT